MISDFGSSRFGVWIIKHLVSPLQRWLYRVTGGRVMANLGGERNVLLLTTTGRRTGKARTTPLFYLDDGEAIVICNVKPALERTNPWVLNLRANSIVRAQIGPNIDTYEAHAASDEEIDRLWPRLVKVWPAYQVHFERGGRRSIFLLERVGIESPLVTKETMSI